MLHSRQLATRDIADVDVRLDSHFRLGKQLLQLVEQVSLAATHVQNPGVGLEVVNGNQLLGHHFPAAVILVAAVTVAAIAVSVVELVLSGLDHAVDFVVHHPADIIPLGFFVKRGDNA